MASEPASSKLLRAIDRSRDHVRGGSARGGIVSVVVYGDYLCPYCRRLRHVLARLRQALGERLAYVFRQFPNERAHPGATLISATTLLLAGSMRETTPLGSLGIHADPAPNAIPPSVSAGPTDVT